MDRSGKRVSFSPIFGISKNPRITKTNTREETQQTNSSGIFHSVIRIKRNKSTSPYYTQLSMTAYTMKKNQMDGY
jgi:hypothetical protein